MTWTRQWAAIRLSASHFTKGEITMRRGVLSIAIALLGVTIGVVGLAQNGVPKHPHMMVHQPEFGFIDGSFAVLGWKKCVDLAANRALPLQAHHEHIHTGTAGEALAENADIHVIPGAPLTPWANCAELEAALPILLE
jgi:hypothetical protein